MSRPAPQPPTGRAEWARMTAVLGVLLVFVLVPFALWGDALERAAPLWLQAQDARVWLAVFGVALLVVDVALPVPSSLVAVMLCLALGPLWGGACVATGAWLSFVVGYGLGRLVPESRLRRWVGPALWDRLRDRASDRALWWIAVARPLPVLAEVSALLAGVWRLPPLRAFAHAAAAAVVLGALYGASVWIGRDAPHIAATVLALLLLPAVTWWLHRIAVRRLLSPARPETPLSTDQEAP
jgi:uncharacterized membrane protein YdjX (TVP38/TMEM64 family)